MSKAIFASWIVFLAAASCGSARTAGTVGGTGGEEPEGTGGAVQVDGKMVDRPVLLKARALLDRART